METNAKSMRQKVVRVVARVRPSTDLATESSAGSVSVHKPMGDESETVSISFGAQLVGSKDSYKVDYCYEENESTGLIITKEIKPLISSVFEGKEANVIAHGARSSGKTYLIQGNEREPGLAILAMSEMLSMAEEKGNSISVSVYEVFHETVYDLLDQEKRVVSVLESAQGKIQLKGLSQVPVKSLSEFQNLCFGLKKSQKLTADPPLRSHRGVMIHVTKGNVNSSTLGRMNFLDMAGYEDSRKQNSDLTSLEITRINKSIYALQNVMHALNANESHVPYRESKLTRMLKDCLQRCNRTLLITCLPRAFSQDSFYMLNLASRICLGGNRAMNNLTKKNINPLARSISLSSTAQMRQTTLSVSRKHTVVRGNVTERKVKLNTAASAIKGNVAERKIKLNTAASAIKGNVTERKIKLNNAASAIKGRKLFGEANDSVKFKNNSKKMEGKARMALKKEISTSKVIMNVQASLNEDEVCSSFTVTDLQSSLVEEENSAPAFSSSAVFMEPVNSPSTNSQHHLKQMQKIVERDENDSVIEEDMAVVNEGENLDKAIEEDLTLVNEGGNLDKENNSLVANETASPPLSIRLQELSNTLKSMCNNTPSVAEIYEAALIKSQAEEVSEHSDIAVVSVEPRTPERSMPLDTSCSSPWKTFSAHSSKLKKSAVGEYLRFLNTAGKEDLKKLKGIGEKRATYIVELREDSPEPFKTLDDLKDIGLSEKQIKGLLRKEVGEIFH